MTAQLVSLATPPSSSLALPDSGLVVYMSLTNNESAVLYDPSIASGFAWSLTSALQNSKDATASTVVIAWPKAHLSQSANEFASLVREIAIGVVQSAQLDVGVRKTRVNLVLCEEDQIEDVNRTLNYFHSDEGSFTVGCTFDLRESTIGATR